MPCPYCTAPPTTPMARRTTLSLPHVIGAKARHAASVHALPRLAGYNPTLAAALSWNRLPARIYLRTIGRLLWPV